MTPPKRKSVKKRVAPAFAAVHAKHKDGIHHLVGFGNIRVLLMPERGGWFAQGLEIDYAAQGDTIRAAKKEFEDGLEAAVDAHLKKNGTVTALLNPAPFEIWKQIIDPSVRVRLYSQVTKHHVIVDRSNYEGIAYFSAATHEGPEGTCQ